VNRWTLARRSLVFFRRTNAGIAAGAAVGAAVLVGALLVGDSVRQSLVRQTHARIGKVDGALVGGDRFVRAAVAADIQEELTGGPEGRGPAPPSIVPVLRLAGLASTPDGEHRATGVQVHGVDFRFFRLGLASGDGGSDDDAAAPGPGETWLNERLARQLGVEIGDTVVLRVDRPSAMPRDMVLAVNDDLTVALRVTVAGIAGPEAFGDFGLAASQIPPFNAFVDLPWLQGGIGDADANMLLAAGVDPDAADAAFRNVWTLADAGIDVAEIDGAGEITSRRIFIDGPIEDAAAEIIPGAVGILTYFVNGLAAGERSTPYSMVAAIGPLDPAAATRGGGGGGGDAAVATGRLLPPDVEDDEIVVSAWLAEDLDVRAGDAVEVTYYTLGDGRRLVESSSTFRVHSIVEIAGAAGDPTLMPEFPGLSDAEHCRDWESGVPLDLDRIRDKDETYWDDHGGTPKAFVTLAAGRRMWENRFGGLTAIRMPAGRVADLVPRLRDRLHPADVGLYFQDVRGPALAAGTTATDFGGLFLGLSLFLIVSALLLIALLFGFAVEQRAPEIGTLIAVGFRPVDVRRQFLREGVVLAAAGSIVGAALGVAYTAVMLLGLQTIWRDAIGQTTITLHVGGASLLTGIGSAFVVAAATIWLTVRRVGRRSAVELLAAQSGATDRGVAAGRRGRIAIVVAVACVMLAVGMIVATGADRGPAAAGAFFGAGSLLLVAIVIGAGQVLRRLDQGRPVGGAVGGAVGLPSIGGLGRRNAARRPGRSLAVVALIACGTFLVVAVGANRLDAELNAGDRASGTGGFSLVARSPIGVPRDLRSPDDRAAVGLDPGVFAETRFVPMRVHDGDDASCLNLSLSQQPRLLGVEPEDLASRKAFTFTSTLPPAGEASPWRLLDGDLDAEDGVRVIPGIGDQASLTWAMHKAVGETLDYRDERGRPFRVRVVGALANSILQGNLLISERWFTRLYPSESGARMFLIDTPPDGPAGAEVVSAGLSRALADVGIEVTPAATRLAEFNAVQNTYLAIFQVLGALGVLLGSVGLGMVVLRNVLERRSEFAVLRAVGWRSRALRWLVFSEHGMLLVLGLAGGAVAAIVAVVPALRSPGAGFPIGRSIAFVLVIAGSGAFWVWIATAWGLRGRILDALRNE